MRWGSLVQMKRPSITNCQDTHNPQTPHATRSILLHNPFMVVALSDIYPW